MTLFEISDIIGIAAFSLSGYMVALRKQLDILGVFLIAFVTALGGGIIRDVLVGNDIYALKNSMPVLVVLIVVMLALLFKLNNSADIEKKKFFIVSDSIGLTAFAISGTLLAIRAEFSIFGIILIAMITSVGGGIIRDVLVNKIPFVLTQDFYATIAIIVALEIILLNEINLVNEFTLILIFLIGLMLRLIAYYKKWRLPMLGEKK